MLFSCRWIIIPIMKTRAEYQQILKLHQDGYSHSYISKLLNISRFTIRETVTNPEAALSRGENTQNCFPSREELSKIAASSVSFLEVLKTCKLTISGGNWRKIQSALLKWEIDTSHFLSKGHNKTSRSLVEFNTIPIESILVENSTYQTSKLSKRLRKENILDYRCSNCGLLDKWNGKEITLHLDHINGVNNDHRLENLRFLCPNCHSQTETYCGRNARGSFKRIKVKQPSKKVKEVSLCSNCKEELADKRAKQCRQCNTQSRRKNVQ